jgi:hypothetical protein
MQEQALAWPVAQSTSLAPMPFGPRSWRCKPPQQTGELPLISPTPSYIFLGTTTGVKRSNHPQQTLSKAG